MALNDIRSTGADGETFGDIWLLQCFTWDYYRVLKVRRNAEEQELNEAYQREIAAVSLLRWRSWRKLRRALVCLAYETLLDPERRLGYTERLDRFRDLLSRPPC
jgi:hypothetical protein